MEDLPADLVEQLRQHFASAPPASGASGDPTAARAAAAAPTATSPPADHHRRERSRRGRKEAAKSPTDGGTRSDRQGQRSASEEETSVGPRPAAPADAPVDEPFNLWSAPMHRCAVSFDECLLRPSSQQRADIVRRYFERCPLPRPRVIYISSGVAADVECFERMRGIAAAWRDLALESFRLKLDAALKSMRFQLKHSGKTLRWCGYAGCMETFRKTPSYCAHVHAKHATELKQRRGECRTCNPLMLLLEESQARSSIVAKECHELLDHYRRFCDTRFTMQLLERRVLSLAYPTIPTEPEADLSAAATTQPSDPADASAPTASIAALATAPPPSPPAAKALASQEKPPATPPMPPVRHHVSAAAPRENGAADVCAVDAGASVRPEACECQSVTSTSYTTYCDEREPEEEAEELV